MKDLIIAAYDGSLRALQTLDNMTALNFAWLPDVDSALVVIRDAEGRLDVQCTYPPSADDAPDGRVFWGVLLAGLVLAPVTGGVSAATAGTIVAGASGAAAVTHLATESGEFFMPVDIGLPADYITRASESIQPGYSAIVALVESHEPNEVHSFLSATRAEVNSITLTPEQLEQFQQLRPGSEVFGQVSSG